MRICWKRAVLASIIAVGLWVVTASMARAQCTPTGWAVGLYFEEQDSVHYYFEGPAKTWVDEGVVDGKGATWRIDDRLFSQSGVLVLQITNAEGEVMRAALHHVEGYCTFMSEDEGDGRRIVFANMKAWDRHFHPDIKEAGHDDGWR